MKRVWWFVRDVQGTSMKEVNLGFLYQLGYHIHDLSELDKKGRLAIFKASARVSPSIRQLLDDYPDLAVCHSRGVRLLSILSMIDNWFENLFKQKNPNLDKPDEQIDLLCSMAIEQAREFELVLVADLEALTAYHPLQKGAFNTQLLVSQAEIAFSESIREKLDIKTIEEIRESGRCLVFDNYTATGFHLMRAVEIVLHQYYVLRCIPEHPTKTLGNWGAYISALHKLIEETSNTAKDVQDHIKMVLALIQLIKDQDRNLIVHPEIVLTQDDALDLFDKCKSAINAMASKLAEQGIEAD